MPRAPRIATIGAYGWTAEGFAAALQRAEVRTLVDIRRRRGVRGLPFANAARLQELVEGLGIAYVHQLELAPSAALLARQHAIDKAAGQRQRDRERLSPEYVAGFTREVLRDFDARAFATSLGARAGAIALFCVEGRPEICHRSLIAERLQAVLRAPVEHLLPPP